MSLLNDIEMEKTTNTVVSDNSNSVISVLGDATMDLKEIPASQVVEPVPVANKKRRQGLMDITELSPELLSAYKIVTQLMSVSNKNVNYAFMNPINYSEPENENYTEVIKKPMWLNKVKLKLLSGRYNTISQVVRDLRLVLENCYRFYGPAHTITKKAIKLETMLEQKLALLPRELKEKTSLQLTTPELVNKVENNVKATNSKTTPKLGSHKDETSMILNCVRQARAKQEREARRLQMEEKRAERDATNQELAQWEESFYGNELTGVKKMWELPQIGHFLYLVQTVLNIPEVSQFELERSFLKPQCSSLLASIMTSLLSSPHQRAKLDEIPAMTYKIWQSRLKMKVQAWYRVFNYRAKSPVKVFEATGVEPTFFSVMGHENPLDSKEFHELNLRQRVWLVKSMCDHCLQNHKTIQDAISESSLLDQKEYALGNDRDESTYIHFPQFCGQSLRVYKQYFDAGEAPDLEFPLLLDEVKNEICENNSEEESERDVKVEPQKSSPGKKKKEAIKKEEKEATPTPTPTPKKRKGRKTTAWSSRRRKTRKKVIEDEPEEEEDVKPNIIPFFELVVDNIESLRKLTAKFSNKDGKEDETATPAASTSAPDTPSSSRTSPSPAPSPIPDEILAATPNPRSSRRSKLLATIALKKGSSTPEAKKEKKKEIKEESEAEENSEKAPPQNADEKNLCKRLVNLLKELEPWEQKLDQADRKIRFKLKKEWEDYQTKVISPEAEAANEYWLADEFTALAAAAKLEDQVSSSSDDESFYINAEKELAEATQASKGGNEELTAADGSQFRKTHYRRCTKRQRVDRNVVTGPISSSEEQEPESDESSGSASSFHISVSSRGRIRKTKKLGFSFENQNDKTTKNESKEVKEVVNKPNGLVVALDNKKRDLDNDAKSQYQWETMRQLIVDNSPKEIMTPLVPKLKIFKAKTSTTEDASPQNQPILENLLASQPGFGEMRPKTQTNQVSSNETTGKLPDEPKYLQSFIQKHYQAPTQPKPLAFFRKDPNTVESPTKTVVIRQSKDGGAKVIETSFAKHGTMKTTVSTTNQEVVLAKKSKPGPKPRQRQTCYANANAPVSTTATNTKVASSSTFVANVYKPGATQTDPVNNQLENKTATTQMRVVVPQSQIRMLNQQPQQVIYRNQVPQQVIYRPQQGNQTFRGQLVSSGPQRGNQQVLYRLEPPNPNAVQPNVPGPQENQSQQVIYRPPQQEHTEIQQNIQGNQSPQVIYRPPQPQGNPGPPRVIQRTPGPTRPQQVIQRNSAPQPVYVQQRENPGPGKVMLRNPNSQQVMTRNPNPHQVMIRNPNSQQGMQRNPNPQQIMIRNPNAPQGMQRNPNPQQIMIRNPNAPQVMIRNPNAQQVMQINSNPQQVMQRNPNPQQVLQGNQNPQLVMPGQVSQQVIFKSHPTNPSPTSGTYRPQPQGSPQQINYRAPPPNPGPSQVILRPQHRVAMPQPANTRPQYTIAAPQQSNTQHQYRPQTPPQQANFNPHAPQLANYNPQGSQPGTFASPATQQTNYHPQGNFGPPVSQQGLFASQPNQQSNFNPQTTLQTNYHTQGNFNPQAPQHGNYHPQASQQGNFNPQSPQQGNFNPQSPQQGNFNPQSPQQGNFASQAPQQGNYNSQTPQQGNYNPPTPQQGNYNPPTPQPANYNVPPPQQANYNSPASQQVSYNTPVASQQGNYNPPTPQQGNYNPPTPQPGNYNTPAPQPGNYPPTPQSGNFNPPAPQPGNFNPPAPQKGNYNPQAPQQGNYNPPAPQQGNYNPQVVQQAGFNPQGVMYGTQQANYNSQTPPVYHQVSRPIAPMQQQGMMTNQEVPEPAREVINQGVSNQIYKVAQAAEGSNSPQQASGQATNSATTRRVMIMPIKGNLPAGQKGPLVFKLVSRNSPNTTNVQSITTAGNVTYAKLVKSSNPGSGTSFVIKQNSNVRGPVPSNSPVVQTPPPMPNQIASQTSNAFLNQTSPQSGQFYQPPPSPRVQYAGAMASPNSPVLSNAQHQIVLNNTTQDPRLNRVMMSNNNVEENLNQQSMVNVQSPANNVVVQCPVQLQTANQVQYVTTTAASPVMSQTNQRVLVCSPNPTFENNPNPAADNVYFLTNSGQLVAFNKNSTQGGATTNIPTSVPHPTITNDNLQNL